MDYSTQVDLVNWVAHEHLVHAKVLIFSESIEDKMSPGRFTKPFVVCCVGARFVNMIWSLAPVDDRFSFSHPT